MKLVDLRLLAFGCFTNTHFDFSEAGRKFHVIFGPNEAGKSTTLRALNGLFFGIPAQTEDAFLHEMKHLRVAAELERKDGQRCTFARRKGNRDTLLATDGKAIPESRLSDFLGGANEEIFGTLFRLDHMALTRSGDDLLKGKGDLAESLFQAGMGITGLRQILTALESEAEQLFKPRGTNSLVNRGLALYDEARRRSRDLSVSPKQWTEHSEAMRAKEEELADIKTRLAEVVERKERLTRLQLALPSATQRKELVDQIKALGEVVELRESAAREREDAERGERDALLRKEQAEAKLVKWRSDLDKLPQCEDLLAETDAVASVTQLLVSYRDAVRQLPNVRAEQTQLDSDALSLFSEVRPGAAIAEAESLRLTVDKRTRIRTLAGQHQKLEERLRLTSDEVASALFEMNQGREALNNSDAPGDATELDEALEIVASHGDPEASVQNETADLRAARESATIELSRLTLWSGTLDELGSLPVPSLETIEVFESERADLANEKHRITREIEQNEQKSVQIDSQIRALRLGGDIPTETELQEARGRREEDWQLVRDDWLDVDSNGEKQLALSARRSLAKTYQTNVSHADGIADRLRREAGRVAKLAGMLADLETCARTTKELETQKNRNAEQFGTWEQRWLGIWQTVGICPLKPKEMRPWLMQQIGLVGRALDVRQQEQTIELLQQRIAEHVSIINQALARHAESGRSKTESFLTFLQRSKSCLKRIKHASQQRIELENGINRLKAGHSTAVRKHDRATADLQEWSASWHSAITPLGLPPETRPEEASAVLEKLDASFRNVADSGKLRLRIEAMQGRIDEFDREIERLVDTLAPDLRGLPRDQAAGRIQGLLTKAQQDNVRRQALASQIDDTELELDGVQKDLAKAGGDLRALLDAADSKDRNGLIDAELKSARSRKLKNDLADMERTLAQFSGGSDLQVFLEELSHANVDRLPFELSELDREAVALDEKRSALDQEVGQERAALHAMDGSGLAAAAAEEAQAALASVRAHSERFLRLRLASQILRRNIDYYREQNQDPVIKRAGEIFSRLTLERFSRLKTGFDEKDRLILLGVRVSGEEVEVSGMSAGTRDQLCLSLRLASLERQLGHGESLPLIVDDAIVNFDDRRAKATLKVLAELACQTQVLLLTHHSRIVELAKEIVPDILLKVHQIGVDDVRGAPALSDHLAGTN